MSVAAPPYAQAPPPSEHHLLGELSAVEAALGRLGEDAWWALPDGGLEQALTTGHRLLATANALVLKLIREVDGRDLPTRSGATSTAAYLRGRLNLSLPAAGRTTRLAAALDSEFTLTGQALAAGTVNLEQADAVVKAVQNLPKTVPADVPARAEQFLLGHAETLDAQALAALGRALKDKYTDPDDDPGDPADRRRLRLTDTPHDTVELRGELDHETAGLLRSALDPLSRPVPGPDGALDPRTADQRRADGLADLLHRAATAGTLPSTGGVRPQVTVTVDLHRLLHGTGPAPEDSWGVPLSQATLERICCDADITRIVFGPDSVPLDPGTRRIAKRSDGSGGRALRLVPAHIRKAVVARDRCCAFPGCDRPASWCEVHHVAHWTRDHGETKLDNLVLLCGRHHRTVHHTEWQVRIAADGLPEFLPPAWIDPQRTPRRNPHRRRHADLLAGTFP
jgi:hypothetical protein